jgi:hypothetical protein
MSQRGEDPRGVRSAAWGLALLIAGLTAGSGTVRGETWSDATGQFKVEAQFLGLKGDKVYLKKKQDGATIAVPLNRLSTESQELARRLAGAAKPIADTPDGAARAVVEALESGNLRGVWDALPPSYQKDANEVVRTFAENMDPDVWKVGTDIVRKVKLLLHQKKKFILAYPAVAESPNSEQLAANWDKIVDAVDALTTSELLDLSKLKTLDVGPFLSGSGKKIVEKLGALTKGAEAAGVSPNPFPGLPVPELPKLDQVKFTTVSVDGDTAKLRIEAAGKEPQVKDAVRVEGKWLPKEMADGWADGMARAKAVLTQEMGPKLKQKKQDVLVPLMMVTGVLDGLLQAKTQQDFNRILDDIAKMAQRFQSGGPAGQPPAASRKSADDFGK